MSKWRYLYRLGLNEYQSKCLCTLIKQGDMTAEEVSEEAEVPYSKVYSVLKNLEDMGMVISTEERPKRFVAKDEEKAIDFLINRKERELSRIRQEAMKAKKEFNAVKTADPENNIYRQTTLGFQ